MKTKSRRRLILSSTVLVAMLILCGIQGWVPFVTIGLAALGTILWGSVVRLHYPQFGGLLGGCIASIIELVLHPRFVALAVWIDNLTVAIVVSFFIVSVLDVFWRNDVKAS